MKENIFESAFVVSWKTKSGDCQVVVQDEMCARKLFADLSSKCETKLFKLEESEFKEIL